MKNIDVLIEIRDECKFRRNCSGCMFDHNGGCALVATPEEWDLEAFEDEER